jgi:hypothetical protein
LPFDGQQSPAEAEEPRRGDDDAETAAPGPAASPFAIANQAPGFAPFQYPAAPYGVITGSVIEDLDFLGWWAPGAAGYDIRQARTVSLADFYSPAGEDGVELLMISAVAVWCSVCKTEYQHMATEAHYAKFRPRGLEMLGILFEDAAAEPATYADLTNWGRAYSVEFPLVMDPAFKSGVFFDKSATPMNMLVDARTMTILSVVTGYNPEIYNVIDNLLAQRGR